MARVRLPSFSASLATRVTSAGSFATFRPSNAARPSGRAFAHGRHRGQGAASPPARSTFTASRAARTANTGSALEKPAWRTMRADIAGELGAEAPGLARGLYERQSGARGRRSAECQHRSRP